MDNIYTETADQIAWITLHRPDFKNAISMETVDELDQVLETYKIDPDVKVIVFTGEGDTFISGGDLTQFIAARGREQALPLLQKVGSLLNKIDMYPKPTIAMINGTAIGGGCEFATACHFRFASEQAKIGFVQIGMHITTGWGGGSRLLAKIPESKALSLLLTGERLLAKRAKELGFIDEVYSHEALREEVISFARKISAQPLAGIQAYLRMLAWRREGVSYEECIQQEIEQCAEMWGSDKHVAVVQRFLNKK